MKSVSCLYAGWMSLQPLGLWLSNWPSCPVPTVQRSNSISASCKRPDSDATATFPHSRGECYSVFFKLSESRTDHCCCATMCEGAQNCNSYISKHLITSHEKLKFPINRWGSSKCIYDWPKYESGMSVTMWKCNKILRINGTNTEHFDSFSKRQRAVLDESCRCKHVDVDACWPQSQSSHTELVVRWAFYSNFLY